MAFGFVSLDPSPPPAGPWTVGSTGLLRRLIKGAGLVARHPILTARVALLALAPGLRPLWRQQPTALLRYSIPAYAIGMAPADRTEFLVRHYRRLGRFFGSQSAARIFGSGLELWSRRAEGASLSVALEVNPPFNLEGESNLVMRIDGERIYVLSFVIGPAERLGAGPGEALMVTQLQGMRGTGPLVRLATKAMSDVGPQLLLMAVAQGIATALRVRRIIGIGAARQVCVPAAGPNGDFLSAYDQFWQSIEGERLASGDYQFPVPIRDKPLAQIKLNHRGRVRRRRAVRTTIAAAVRRRLRAMRRDGDLAAP